MNYGIILRLLAVILWTLSFAMALCLGVDWFYDDAQAVAGFGLSITITGITGLALFFAGRGSSRSLFRKEALALIGLGWLLASLFGALPYLLVLPECTFANAVFESTSGLTTTGATAFEKFEHWPHSLLFWRSLTQWIGGLGVVVFFVAILGFLGAQAKLLYSNEASAQSQEIDDARIQQGILRIVYLYLGLSGLCTLAYVLCGLSTFDAITHMFTTVSTGGFSPREASIGAFANPALEWTAMIFMILGGVSFLVMLRVLRGDFRTLLINSEFKGYLLLLGGSVLVVAFFHYTLDGPLDFESSIRDAAFHVVSIVTTTGYVTADYDAWPEVTKSIILVLMAIGGSAGSTSGGVKVGRVVLGVKLLRLHLEHAYRPAVVRTVKMNGRTISTEGREGAIHFILLATAIFAIGFLVVSMLEPNLSVKGALSTTLSTLLNIGPGFSEIGPTQNYGFFREPTKLFLSLLMITGRLEFYAILVLFIPAFWKRFS